MTTETPQDQARNELLRIFDDISPAKRDGFLSAIREAGKMFSKQRSPYEAVVYAAGLIEEATIMAADKKRRKALPIIFCLARVQLANAAAQLRAAA